MPERVAIRLAEPADAETLVELRELMFTEMGVDDAPSITRLRDLAVPWTRGALESGDAFGLVAEVDGRVVGGVTMSVNRTQPQRRVPDGRVAMVYGLFVVEDERGRGLGRRLVEGCVELARERGIRLVALHAAPRARPIYERIGFEASSEMVLFLGEERD